MPKIVHFEVNADDPLRAKSFYEEVFNWKIEKSEMPMDYWMITAGSEDKKVLTVDYKKGKILQMKFLIILGYLQLMNFVKK